jgi:hypothetical protein
MREWEYWTLNMENVQFYIPALLDRLREMGEPLLIPVNAGNSDIKRITSMPLTSRLDISPADRTDVGDSTHTAMFVPPGSGAACWLKVYIEDEEYLLKHPDVRSARLTAIAHFCLYGHKEPLRVQSLRNKRRYRLSSEHALV